MRASAERAFLLPRGWTDARGELHRRVSMRPARARDELRALGDFRVFLDPDRIEGVLLARVTTRLGSIEQPDEAAFGNLCEEDRLALESAYRELNGYPPAPGLAPAVWLEATAGAGSVSDEART